MVAPSEADLAHLSGPELVRHLRQTHLRSDFEAVASVLEARDRRLVKYEAALETALADLSAAKERERGMAEVMAELEAALADYKALWEKGEALRDAHRRLRGEAEEAALLDAHRHPRDEAEEMDLLVRPAAPDPVHPEQRGVEGVKEGEVKQPDDIIDLCSDDEEEELPVHPCKQEMDFGEDDEDDKPLSQLCKRLWRGEPGALESREGEGQQQGNLVSTLARKMVGTPEDPMLTPLTVLLPSGERPGSSTLQKVSSKSDHGRYRTGEKEGSSGDDVPSKRVSQSLKQNAKMNKTPMVESSAGVWNKEGGAEMQKTRIARQGVLFEPWNSNITCAQVKRETGSLPSAVTRNWESEGDMITSLIENVELSMQALCALYRQKKLTLENAGLTFRATKLAEFLLDSDLQGPMKRTAEELENQDPSNSSFLQQVGLDLSGQLFDIFRNKEDRYFC
ncbi:uncharacterized protein LOC100842741 [Brachypodium distachyon]|uniref:Uncharacterized protein n=1 Tax=Brachypodium distachyon TaxID=15368 RepID=I1HQ06_BRADI|nr:uncharacterized protein LOC100842741 [Brachypodium distachyon]PNT72527.1 hypothetical protein BRADI_2g45500v3 [Brachypodium distachyon]|eukprot:XP_003566952.1 uncharacterized protein LOC100842741 [Brachypodium distachyon]